MYTKVTKHSHSHAHNYYFIISHSHGPTLFCYSGWLAGYLDDFLAGTCFEAGLFRWWGCWQLRIFLTLSYIYSID